MNIADKIPGIENDQQLLATAVILSTILLAFAYGSGSLNTLVQGADDFECGSNPLLESHVYPSGNDDPYTDWNELENDLENQDSSLAQAKEGLNLQKQDGVIVYEVDCSDGSDLGGGQQ